MALAEATLAIGIVGHVGSPVVLIVVLATLCVAQLGLSLAGRACNPLAHASLLPQQRLDATR